MGSAFRVLNEGGPNTVCIYSGNSSIQISTWYTCDLRRRGQGRFTRGELSPLTLNDVEGMDTIDSLRYARSKDSLYPIGVI